MIIYGKDSLLNQLKNRNRSFQNVAKYMTPVIRKAYVSSIFRGKLLYGIETWGGTSKTNLQKLQNEQSKAAKFALGPKFDKKIR